MLGSVCGDCSLHYLRMTLKKRANKELGLSWGFNMGAEEEAAQGDDNRVMACYPC